MNRLFRVRIKNMLLQVLANLEHLNLTECGVDDASLAPLKDLPHLKTPIVEGNPEVSEQTLRRILEASNAD